MITRQMVKDKTYKDTHEKVLKEIEEVSMEDHKGLSILDDGLFMEMYAVYVMIHRQCSNEPF